MATPPVDAAAILLIETDGLKEVADWSKEYYVVAVSGMRGMGGGTGPGGGLGAAGGREGQKSPENRQDSDPQQRMAAMRERMKEASSLQFGSRGPMQPARIETVRGESGPVTIFLFPRVSDISGSDKDIQFFTALGPMVVKAKFALKDMSVKGKLEL